MKPSRADRRGRGTLGNLEHLALPEIMQTLAVGRKTARVSLTSQGRWGHIWIERGIAKHARTRGAVGEIAFYEMVGWRTGEFLIEAGVRTETRSLDHDPLYLVMEGARRLDERESEEAGLVSPEALDTVPLADSIAGGSADPDRRAILAPPERRSAPRRVRRWSLPLTLALLAGLASVAALLSPRAERVPRPETVRHLPPDVEPRADAPEPASFDTAAPVEHESTPDPVPETVTKSPRRVARPPLPAVAAPAPSPSTTAPAEPASGGPGPALAPPVPRPEAVLALSAESRLDGGTLVLLVDGEEAFRRALTGERTKRRGFRKVEAFAAEIPLGAGTHRVAARVIPNDDDDALEDAVDVSVAAGASRELRLVVGGRRGMRLSVGEASVPAKEVR